MRPDGLALNQLQVGESAEVADIFSGDEMKRRFQDLGLIRGTKVVCVAESAFRDLRVYQIRGAYIAIRSGDAEKIVLMRGVKGLAGHRKRRPL